MDITLNQYLNRSNEILQNTKIRFNLLNMKKEHDIMLNNIKHIYESLLKNDNIIKNLIFDDDKSDLINNTILCKNYDISNIINNNIYYIQDINQYCIKINNMILRGNIGNIYMKQMLTQNNLITNIFICNKFNECKNILNNEVCKFYHDPLELLKLKDKNIISDAFYKKQISNTKNFINTSWMYYNSFKNKRNKHMRNFGSKAYLKYDIDYMKISKDKSIMMDIENFKLQVMHDILILLSLHDNKLFE
jgi:hypothetical protein